MSLSHSRNVSATIESLLSQFKYLYGLQHKQQHQQQPDQDVNTSNSSELKNNHNSYNCNENKELISLVQKLVERFKPIDITDIVTRQLFDSLELCQTQQQTNTISLVGQKMDDTLHSNTVVQAAEALNFHDALVLLGLLISNKTDAFLKAASKSIRNEAIRRLHVAPTGTLTAESPITSSDTPSVIVSKEEDVKRDERNTAVARLTSMREEDSSDFALTRLRELTRVLVLYMSAAEDVETSTNAAEAIVALCRRFGGSFHSSSDNYIHKVFDLIATEWKNAASILNSTTHNEMKNKKTLASNVIVRCANLLIELLRRASEDSTKLMEMALHSGIMDLFVDVLDDNCDDPLLIVSMLDLLEQLALDTKSKQTNNTNNNITWNDALDLNVSWLLSLDVLEPILEMAGGLPNNDGIMEPDPILGGLALRVVAALSALGLQNRKLLMAPHLRDTHGADDSKQNDEEKTLPINVVEGFHRALHNFVETNIGNGRNELDRLAVIDAISSFVSSSSEALDLIISDPVTRSAWLGFTSVAQPRLKSAILVSIAHVIAKTPLMQNGDQNGQQLHLLRQERILSDADCIKLLNMVGIVNSSSSNINRTSGAFDVVAGLLLQLTKSPITVVRLGTYTLLHAMCTIPVACQQLLNYRHREDGTTFYDNFLLNRETETTPVGREGKYSIVQAIYNNETVRTLLTDEVQQQLQTFLQQGPHYQKSLTWDVATE